MKITLSQLRKALREEIGPSKLQHWNNNENHKSTTQTDY